MKYGELVTSWAETGGKPVIITQGGREWEAWELYYYQMDVQFALDLMKGRNAWTVPSEFPGQFDQSFDPRRGRIKKDQAHQGPSLPIGERMAFVAEQLSKIQYMDKP